MSDVTSCRRLTLSGEENQMVGEVVKYSEAFKRQVVRDLERGRFRSHSEARERYGIGGGGTVGVWIRKYGSERMQKKIVRVESPEERDQIQALKARIKELERAVVDSKVNEALYKAYFDVVCRECGVTDPEGLKKNIARKLSGEEPNTARRKKG